MRLRTLRPIQKFFSTPYGATLTKHILGGTRQARRATQEQNGNLKGSVLLALGDFTAEKHSLYFAYVVSFIPAHNLRAKQKPRRLAGLYRRSELSFPEL